MITRRHAGWRYHDLRGEAGAVFSPCEKYRYALWRTWNEVLPILVFLGLNPSTATETLEDPTIRRVIALARRLGCGSMTMLNIFALRSTDPKRLYEVVDPIGPDNDAQIREWIRKPFAAHVVAGWGAHGSLMDRGRNVALAIAEQIDRPPRCLGMTKEGQPKHPLYLPNDTSLVELVA